MITGGSVIRFYERGLIRGGLMKGFCERGDHMCVKVKSGKITDNIPE